MKDPLEAGCVLSKETAQSISSEKRGMDAIWLGDVVGLGGPPGGQKFDQAKLRYDLIDDAAEAEFVAVLSFGAVKYDPGNWIKVEDALERYFAAFRRHLRAFRKGEHFDAETGLHHLAAAKCCVHFMLGIVLRNNPGMVESLDTRLASALVKAHRLRALRENRPTGS